MASTVPMADEDRTIYCMTANNHIVHVLAILRGPYGMNHKLVSELLRKSLLMCDVTSESQCEDDATSISAIKTLFLWL